ncbi:MAG: hypothetical protein C0622_14355 [Desulfuromonas sp.]|nr:MAG: hypothetical protein C0622_14355 [Desulfuromonas sp.]
MVDGIINYLTEHLFMDAAVAGLVVTLVTTGVKAYFRRPTKTSQGGVFLTKPELLTPPAQRPAYSDRMAYILAEMSALAYFKFEGDEDGALQQAIEKLRRLLGGDAGQLDEKIGELLVELQDQLLFKPLDGSDVLTEILKRADFELVDTIAIGSTQGFACKRVKEGEAPYLLISFRGTEKVLEDWLTDADAVPDPDILEEKGIKLHKGFWKVLHDKAEVKSKVKAEAEVLNVLEQVQAILDSDAAQENGQKLPCYFTGHSLGGALALLVTRELAPDINGACYTFGAPRVADYQYFCNMKTPVYRVVNSSDIVPRVPPGAGMGLLLKLVQGASWLTQFIPQAKKPLAELEKKVDQLNGYRHHGDQRYLTDVKNSDFGSVQLLSNPPAIDRIWWMWQHVRKSFNEPVKSHGMAIYRRKLLEIAVRRNPGA